MRTIVLTRGAESVVDDEDFVVLSRHSWHLTAYGYAATSIGKKIVLMHRLLLGLSRGDGRRADHRNGNRLDNRMTNLRVTDASGNARNAAKTTSPRTSRFKGVSWDEATGLWRAVIVVDRRQRSLGRHPSEEAAARAYDVAARALHGEYASPNAENAR